MVRFLVCLQVDRPSPLITTVRCQMVRVKQHGEDGTLNDISRFLPDIDRFFTPDYWIVGDLEIIGENALEIEERCGSGIRLPDAEFRTMYKGIFQTYWGYFGIESKGELVAQIDAIDSSFWEVQSANVDFEDHMLQRYGKYGA